MLLFLLLDVVVLVTRWYWWGWSLVRNYFFVFLLRAVSGYITPLTLCDA